MSTGDTFRSYNILAYRDLTTYYPDPTTGEPLPHGWVGQLAFNTTQLFEAMATPNAIADSSVAGADIYTPDLTGITAGTNWTTGGFGYGARYLQVGQLCHVRIAVDATAFETATGFSVPLPAARSVIASIVGAGVAYQPPSTRTPIYGRLEDQTIMFYHPDGTANNGQVGSTSPLDPSTSDVSIFFHGIYRTTAPPEGRLNQRVRVSRAG